MSESHPYKSQPSKAFWLPTVAQRHHLDIPEWYQKKWDISNSRIAAAGSCFAQHVGRYLRRSGFNFVDVEPPPSFLRQDRWLEYGYNMYSARYGNVYSARQLLQLLKRALGEFSPREEFWLYKSGVVDPFRPTIEPEPFESVDEAIESRKSHLNAVVQLFEQTDVLVFTLGLTEAWISKEDGSVFPVCPGVHGGAYVSSKYDFINFSYPQVRNDLIEFMRRARSINKNMRFIYTVSPVPLMATATDKQVVVATTYSKSVLRSVAGFLAEQYGFVDYFPSYEIVSSPPVRGSFYAPDMRAVVEAGVEHVMSVFFAEHEPPKNPKALTVESQMDEEDVMCDEEILAVFGKKR